MTEDASSTTTPELPAVATASKAGWLDLLGASTFALVAAVGTALESGSIGRVALTMPMLLFIPGYLLLQAALAGKERSNWFHVMMAIGISPPLVGLLALLTAIVPGGFTATPIIAVITTASIGFAAVALIRRRRASVAA